LRVRLWPVRNEALPEDGSAVKSQTFAIIVVARDAEVARTIDRLFPEGSVQVSRESSIDRVLERLESASYDVLLITSTAFKAGEIDGVELLEVISAKSPATQILFLAAKQDIRLAMSALKAGSYQYARLPIGDEELRLLIEAAVAEKQQTMPSAAETAGRDAAPQELIGRSPQMQAVHGQIRLAATTDIPVLLSGETGTGKDLAGQEIHCQSDRKNGPFVPIHLGALPAELVASELFGHEKGAFTGALEGRQGKFEQAHNGTVFLDEITTIDEKVQVSLLRLIEQRRFSRLGGRKALSTNIRLIAASNQDLDDAVGRGVFREDLYYRLNVFRIVMPPLRERRGDISLLIEHFLKRYNTSFQKNIAGIAPDCFALLESYDWPGNVRELKNVVQRAALVCDSEVILPKHLPPRFRPDRPVRQKMTFEVGTSLDEIEREVIVRTLTAVQDNRRRAAETLGISRRTLYNRLRKYELI